MARAGFPDRKKAQIKKPIGRGMYPRRSSAHKRVPMSLDDMLDVVELVNLNLVDKKLELPSTVNPRVRHIAVKVIELSQDEKTKPQANAMLARLNHQIVQENRKTSDPAEGDILYKKLMKGLVNPQYRKSI
jgi:hypothetical protein